MCTGCGASANPGVRGGRKARGGGSNNSATRLGGQTGRGQAAGTSERQARRSPKEYYAGKTIRIIVGIEPGANGDIQARYIAQSLPKFIPGEPNMIVTNMPGNSGLTATNYIAAQPPDGLTLYWGTGGHPHQQLEQGANAKFKYDELVRVITLEGRTALWLGLGSMPYKRIAGGSRR